MKLIAFLFLFLPFILFGQRYTDRIHVPDKNSGQIYSDAKLWFLSNVQSYGDTIRLEDAVVKKIIAGGTRGIAYECSGIRSKLDIYLTIEIEVNDSTCTYNIFSTRLQIVKGFWFKYEQLSEATEEGFRKFFEQNNKKYRPSKKRKRACDECVECMKRLSGYVEEEVQLIAKELVRVLNQK